jgi:two-component system response regulator HydG
MDPPGSTEHGTLVAIRDVQGMVADTERTLSRSNFRVLACDTVVSAVRLLRERSVDLVLCGLDMGGMSGFDLCRTVFQDHGGIPVVMLLPKADPSLLEAADRAGAFVVLSGQVAPKELEIVLDRAVEYGALRREVERLEHAISEEAEFEDLLGGSRSMRELYDILQRAAKSSASVLLLGETGTGKELVAQALHRRSRRAQGPFVTVNVSAVPDALLESELFGHEKGAFTDAHRERKGLFAEADGGTVFLDEIGEMSLALQPKLLRVLQSKTLRPLGSSREQAVDVRIVSATHRDLQTMVAEGRFREDLYYRLNIIQIDLPPLRSRGSDVLLLAGTMLERAAVREGKEIHGISNGAARTLLEYPWPGNVRELDNCIERAVALCRGSKVDVDDLPRRVRDYRAENVLVTADDPEAFVPMHVVERRYIERVMAAVGGNRTKAARLLGLDRKTLYRKLKRYGMAQGLDDEAGAD